VVDNSGKRKLAAILSADAKDYSRLMDDDEEATVHTLTNYREVIFDLVHRHHGRVVDSPGDNLLAEFSSVVDAMRCAWDVQQELSIRNAELDENRRMHFRIGINLGDVIEEKGRLYGDGVNVAARLEGLAEPGGIHISGSAYDQVKNKLPYRFEYTGEQQVKNIRDPVRAYRVVMESRDSASGFRLKPKERGGSLRASRLLIFAAGIVALAVGLYFWVDMHVRSLSDKPPADGASRQMYQKPSIAVLPFKNLSDDPQQAYFSDGITNDIITELSKFRELIVIASNTVFTYKGQPVKVKQVGRELDVRYVLEGSTQKSAERVRINAQLVDADTEQHLWAQRYDRELKDIFSVQDDIVHTITGTLAVKVDDAERKRITRKDMANLVAYDYVLRGREYISRTTRSSNAKARQMFQKAIELDSNYVTAYVYLGWTYINATAYGWTEFIGPAIQRANDLAQKALSIEESAAAHALLGNVYRIRQQFDLAASELDKAIALNPNDAESHANRGIQLNYLGQTDEAIQAIQTAQRFDPNMLPRHFMHLGLAYYLKGRYADSIRILEHSIGRYPREVFLHIALAAAYAQAGRSEDAGREAQTVMKLHPFFEINSYRPVFKKSFHREAIVEGLRKAGLK